MGRARSASDLFKMLNPNTCVFRDFGRRGSQSQGRQERGMERLTGFVHGHVDAVLSSGLRGAARPVAHAHANALLELLRRQPMLR